MENAKISKIKKSASVMATVLKVVRVIFTVVAIICLVCGIICFFATGKTEGTVMYDRSAFFFRFRKQIMWKVTALISSIHSELKM